MPIRGPLPKLKPPILHPDIKDVAADASVGARDESEGEGESKGPAKGRSPPTPLGLTSPEKRRCCVNDDPPKFRFGTPCGG